MKKVLILVLALVLVLALGASAAFAAVSGTQPGSDCGPSIPGGRVYLVDNTAAKIDANPVIVADPTGLDLRLHYYESDTEIRVFNEQQNVSVTGLAHDGGSYTGNVDSHLMHQEPTLGTPGQTTPTPYTDAMRGRGCISFDTNIIGVIISDADLDASDGVVGLATVTYPTGQSLRGLEMGSGRNYQDVIEVNGDTIKVDLQSVEVMDQIRVLTEPAVGPAEAVEVDKDYRYTDVCFEKDNDLDGQFNEDPVDFVDNDLDGLIDEDPVDCPLGTYLGDLLPTVAEDTYQLEAVIHPKNNKVKSYNPGQYYAVSTVTVLEDVETLTIVENWGDCGCTDPPISVLNPKKGGGSVVIVQVGPGDAVAYQILDATSPDVTIDTCNGSKPSEATVELGPVEAGTTILMYVKFGPGLKGEVWDPPYECVNSNTATATIDGGSYSGEALAYLVVVEKD